MTDTSREALTKVSQATGNRLDLITRLRANGGRLSIDVANMLEADAQRITELEALSVTKIMLDVVPGDGSGLEVFAKSTRDVVDLLTKMSEKIEVFESSKQAQQVVVPMTIDEIVAAAGSQHIDVYAASFMCGIRAAEAHHKITPQGDKP